MKIDFYISSLSSGGAENVLITLAVNFAKEGNEVSITSLEKRPQFYEVDSQVSLFKYDNIKKGKLAEIICDYKSVKRQLKTRDSDVIISFLSRCNLLVLICAIFMDKKIIVCDRNNPLKEHSKFIFFLSCLIYKKASSVVVQTNEIKDMYPYFLQKKLVVIENPIDTEKLELQMKDQTIEKENTIISLGRLEPQKDFKTLIKAFSKIADEAPSWRLKIFGKGEMQQELQQYINNCRIDKQVFLCGRTTIPFVELSKAEIFVLSSYYEGFPNVLCEAMYASLPCISTRCVSGPRELICNGENGFLVDIEDVESMALKLIRLINDTDGRRLLGMNGFKSVQRLRLENIFFKWQELINRYKHLKEENIDAIFKEFGGINE